MTAAEWIARQRHLSNRARNSNYALNALEAVLALADNPYPDARNISGADIKRAIEAALRAESWRDGLAL